MKQANSLSLIKKHDGSYFYLIELGLCRGLYKYMLANWQGNHLGEPMIIYSHTKRSKLSEIDKEFFDNNLLSKKRLDKYIKKQNNLYIGGISRNNGLPTREYKEGNQITKNYKVYTRKNNYILIESIKNGEIKSYNINEFINKQNIINFEKSLIYTEKDLLNMNDDSNNEETNYVINNLLKYERVKEKCKNLYGYVGTIIKVGETYKKVANEQNLEIIRKVSAN